MLTHTRAFARAISELDRERHEAADNDMAVMSDQAWAETVTADRHALLVERFLQMSDAEQQLAARLASRPGVRQQEMAQVAQTRSAYYQTVAERHRQASVEHQEEGMRLANEVRSRRRNGGQRPQQAQRPQPQPAQRPQPPQRPPQPAPAGNGGGNA